MAQPQNDIVSKIKFDIDQAALNRAIKSLKFVRQSMAQMTDQAKTHRKSVESMTNAYKRIAPIPTRLRRITFAQRELTKFVVGTTKASKQLSSELKKIDGGKEVDKLAESLGKAEEEGLGVEERLKRINSELRGVGAGSGDFSRVVGGLSGAGGAGDVGDVGGASGGDASRLLGVLLAGLVGQAGRVAKVSPSVVSPEAGASAELLGKAAIGLSQVGVSAATLATGAAILGPLLVVAAVGIHQLTEANKEAIAIQTARLKAGREFARLVASGLTTEAATSNLKELEAQAATTTAELANQQAERDAVFARLLSNAQRNGAGVFADLAVRLREAFPDSLFGEQEEALDKSISELDAELTEIEANIKRFTVAIEDNELAVNDSTFAAEEAAEAERQLALEREAGLKQIEAIEDQIRSRFAAEQRRARQASELQGLEDIFAGEDLVAMANANRDALIKIANDGVNRVKAIQAKLADLPAERNQKLLEAQIKFDDKVATINRSFMKKELANLEKFRQREQRLNEKFNKLIRRTLEDLQDSLNDAEASNDVNAFLDAQRDGQKKLRRLAEDQADDTRQRTEEFVQSQQRERVALEEKTQAALLGLQREQAKISESFEKRREDIAATLQKQEEANQLALQNARDRIAAEEAQREQAHQRQLQREEILARHKQENADRELLELRNRAFAIATMGDGLVQAAGAVAALISRLSGQTPAASARSGGRGRTLFRQAGAGLAARTGGGLGRFGSSPANRSRGLPVERARGGVQGAQTFINFNPNVMVGDIASTAQVTEALRINSSQILQAVSGGISRAV